MAQGSVPMNRAECDIGIFFKFDSIGNGENLPNYIKNVQKPTFPLHIIRKKHLKIRK